MYEDDSLFFGPNKIFFKFWTPKINHKNLLRWYLYCNILNLYTNYITETSTLYYNAINLYISYITKTWYIFYAVGTTLVSSTRVFQKNPIYARKYTLQAQITLYINLSFWNITNLLSTPNFFSPKPPPNFVRKLALT